MAFTNNKDEDSFAAAYAEWARVHGPPKPEVPRETPEEIEALSNRLAQQVAASRQEFLDALVAHLKKGKP